MPIVNIRTEACDVYIGAAGQVGHEHFGNPFSHVPAPGVIHCTTREVAIQRFELWLLGYSYIDVKQEQRKWIIENLHTLKGKKLGCYCAPLACHGSILEKYAYV